MSKKRILVLGGTGAMGRYLVPELLSMGFQVDCAALDNITSENPSLKYIRCNIKENNNLRELVSQKYDAIVDFLTYTTKEFEDVYKLFLDNTDQYIFLSSCRVYADMPPISEKTPRLLEVSTDKTFLATEDYALYKAKEENLLYNSGKKNWTIVRPATTYSTGRFQLVTLEADTVLYRIAKNKTIVLPEEAMNKNATMSWGGDVGKMIARLVLNPRAYGEDYIVSTSEHNTWKEIAEIYNSICPFKYVTASTDDYIDILGGSDWVKYQLIYARLFQRITDNSKILEHTGMKQSELMTLKDGLLFEFERSKNIDVEKFATYDRNIRMDKYLMSHGIE